MIFRKSVPEDAPAIAALFDAARVSMRALGIDQWQKGVPGLHEAKNDAETGIGRVIEEDGEILAAYSFLTDGEPCYDHIEDGEWKTDGSHYAAVHRVVISAAHRGSGLSTAMVEKIAEEARAGGFVSIRIDTHPGNIPMRRMLEKNGFVREGYQRDAVYKDGEVYDLCIYGKLK